MFLYKFENCLLKGYTGKIHSLAFSPDGLMIASGSSG